MVVGSDFRQGQLLNIDISQFAPFFSTEKSPGPGLAVNRTIIEAHGGRLWAENNADHGATFCFTLPTVSAVEAA